MAKMHLDIDEQRKFICCLNVRCLSKYIPRNLMDSCSFVSPTICMGLLLMNNLLLMSMCTFDGGLNNVQYVLFIFNESLYNKSQSYSFLIGHLLQQLTL